MSFALVSFLQRWTNSDSTTGEFTALLPQYIQLVYYATPVSNHHLLVSADELNGLS